MTPAFTLTAQETGTAYHVYVETSSAAPNAAPLPAMLFLDGDDQFEAAVSAYRSARSEGAVPPLLLVGVGYGASYRKPANKRGRDYTPTHHSDEPSSGGADRFLRFLTDELWPALGARHAIDPAVRGLGGHSLGSLFVLHALAQQPLFFTHYLASAPSIWWDDRSILGLLARRREHDEVLPARLFLSVGAEDTASMTGDLTLLEQQLAARPFRQLVQVSRRFPGKNHFDVLPEAFDAGLRFLFGSHG